MKVILGGRVGAYLPGDTVTVDDIIGDALLTASAALPAPEAAEDQPAHPKYPTVDYVRSYAAEHGLSLSEAAEAIASGA